MQDEIQKHLERVREKTRRPTVTVWLGEGGLERLHKAQAKLQEGHKNKVTQSQIVQAALDRYYDWLFQADDQVGGPVSAPR